MIKISYIVFVSTFIFLITCTISCSKTDYTVQAFTFPKESKVHKNDWTYMVKVIVSSKHTPITDRSDKDVHLTIVDHSENILLEKRYSFFCASIKANVDWAEFDSLKLKLNEVGNSFAKDDYNKTLIENGPFTLIELSLKFDNINKVYY